MVRTTRFYPNKKQKYVLVQITAAAGEEMLLWSNPDIEWHNDIVQEIIAAGHTVSKVFGGGWLLSKPDSKELYVWGKSDRFGPAPREQIKNIIETNLPGIILHLDQEPS